jgi:hypothetical protein
MNLRIPIVCLVFSVVIIGVCIVARGSAAQSSVADQQVHAPAAQVVADR